jgi:hypothetical protein
MLATSSIVAIVIFGSSIILVGILCKKYYNNAKKKWKYEML